MDKHDKPVSQTRKLTVTIPSIVYKELQLLSQKIDRHTTNVASDLLTKAILENAAGGDL